MNVSNIISRSVDDETEDLNLVDVENCEIADAEVRKVVSYDGYTQAYLGVPNDTYIKIDLDEDDQYKFDMTFVVGNNTYTLKPSGGLTVSRRNAFSGGSGTNYSTNGYQIFSPGIRESDISDPSSIDYSIPLLRMNNSRVYIDHVQDSTGQGIILGTKRTNEITYDVNSISLTVKDNGDRAVNISDPAAWRDALEIGDFGKWNSRGTTYNLASGSIKNFKSWKFAPGTYVINCMVLFPSNSTGYRGLYFGSTTTGGGENRLSSITRPAASGMDTIISLAMMKRFSSETTRYFNAYQNSGSQLTITYGVQVLKIV